MAKYDPCCGADIRKKVLAACIRSGDTTETRTYGTTTPDIRAMLTWIQENECELIAMESTGSCWIPVWNLMEELDMPGMLENAQQVRAVPGKKTDKMMHSGWPG